MSDQKIGLEDCKSKDLLKAALFYAACNWPVMPLHTVKNGVCSCGQECKKPGKHPRTAHGLKQATIDMQQIRRWWSMWPDANIGIATGTAAGFWVIDVDQKSGGFESIREWQTNNGELPETVTQLTGGGGEHYFYLMPKEGKISSRVNLLPGVDIRSDGGYIVAPPSNHESGGFYEWQEGCAPDPIAIDFSIEELPQPMLEALKVIKEERPDEAGPVADILAAIPDSPEEKQKLFSALQILDVDDRDQWLKAGMAIHSTGWADGFDLWCAWAMQSQKFNISDSRRVWGSFGNNKGAVASLGSIYRLANEIDPTWNGDQPLQFVVTPGTQADQVLNGISRQAAKLETYRTITDWGDTVKMIPYLIKNLIPQRALGYLFAPQKAKKSFIAIDLAAHICHGLEWCGHRVNKRKVLYISGEGNQSFINRLIGWSKGNGYDLRGRFELLPQGVKIDREEARNRLFATIHKINEAAGDNPEDMVGLVVLDTLARTMSGNENNQQDMSAYVEACDLMRDYFGVTSLIVTHISKGEGREDTTRGSTVLPGAVDFGFKAISNQNDLTGQLISQDVKDGESGGYNIEFNLIDLGADEEGDQINTLAVVNRNKLTNEELKEAKEILNNDSNDKDKKRHKVIRYLVGKYPEGKNISFILEEYRNHLINDNPDLPNNNLRVAKSRVKKELETNAISGVIFDDETGICTPKLYSIFD